MIKDTPQKHLWRREQKLQHLCSSATTTVEQPTPARTKHPMTIQLEQHPTIQFIKHPMMDE